MHIVHRAVKIELCKTALQCTPKQLNIFFKTTRRMSSLISWQKWTPHTAFADLNRPTDGLGYFATCKNLSMKEGVNCLQTWKIFRMLKDKMACCQMACWHAAKKLWKRRLAAVAKRSWGPIQHIFCWSVDWLMTTVAFECSPRIAALSAALHSSIFNSPYVIKRIRGFYENALYKFTFDNNWHLTLTFSDVINDVTEIYK